MTGVATGAKHGLQGGNVGVVHHQAVVAQTTQQHIGATVASKRVVAGVAHQGFIGGGASQGVVCRGSQFVNQGLVEHTIECAKNHVAASGGITGCGAALVGTHQQVGQTVAIDVAGRCHADTTVVAYALANNDKTTLAIGHRAEVDCGARGLAKHHIAGADIGASEAVEPFGTHNQVGQTVAIDVAGAGYAIARQVVGTLAVNDKATRACSHRAEFQRRAAGLAKHHVSAPGIATSGRVSQ